MNIKQAQQQAAQQIKPNGKYTIIGLNDFGFPYVMHTTTEQAYIGRYAQYGLTLMFSTSGGPNSAKMA